VVLALAAFKSASFVASIIGFLFGWIIFPVVKIPFAIAGFGLSLLFSIVGSLLSTVFTVVFLVLTIGLTIKFWSKIFQLSVRVGNAAGCAGRQLRGVRMAAVRQAWTNRLFLWGLVRAWLNAWRSTQAQKVNQWCSKVCKHNPIRSTRSWVERDGGGGEAAPARTHAMDDEPPHQHQHQQHQHTQAFNVGLDQRHQLQQRSKHQQQPQQQLQQRFEEIKQQQQQRTTQASHAHAVVQQQQPQQQQQAPALTPQHAALNTNPEVLEFATAMHDAILVYERQHGMPPGTAAPHQIMTSGALDGWTPKTAAPKQQQGGLYPNLN
jgi:hypothetical protein